VLLLVSVRDADEAREALAAGADILDAKEPALGALAPVAPERLAAIAALVPAGGRWSVALGEPADAAALAALLGERAEALARGPAFLKFVPPTTSLATLGPMVRAARAATATARIVVSGYADRLGGAALGELAHAARAADADGVLLDTSVKDAPLFHHVTPGEAEAFVAVAHGLGLFVALAGSLSLDDLPRLAALGADVAGVRGAACDGGRTGRLSARRVRLLLRAARRDRRAPAAPAW
jgi:uncharacterized protein (UPF0264 family)